MEWLKSKRLPAGFYAVFILCLAGTIVQAVEIYRLESLSRAMTDPLGVVVDEGTPAAVVFAKAHGLDRAGNPEEAIRLYTSLRNAEDRDLRARALHNLATLYLRDGARRWNARGVLEFERVNTLIELAKEDYREALRLNPDDWDARYNLEYAWRITPPPKEKDKSDWRGSKSSVFSTLPGLPAGGP
ncbi:MAG: MxaK protein [Methylococcaceae bacterium]|nr:MxaK protein [Methylococcaceae bacterium]